MLKACHRVITKRYEIGYLGFSHQTKVLGLIGKSRILDKNVLRPFLESLYGQKCFFEKWLKMFPYVKECAQLKRAKATAKV